MVQPVVTVTACGGGLHDNIITHSIGESDAVKRRHAKVKLSVMQCCRSV